jgi:hydroxyethylthiazole kinase-like uncharacterized protein yjeF
MDIPQEVFSVAQIRELEAVAGKELGISSGTLMQCAGASALGYLHEHWPKANRLAVICGTGSNGGDGFVLARLAFARGWDVSVWQVGDPERLKGDALKAAQSCYQVGLVIDDVDDFYDINADVIVDAVVGIGAHGPMREKVLEAIHLINNSDCPVLSIDVPSGLDADTGAVLGEAAVYADATVCFIGLKRGLLTHHGIDHVGTLYCDSLQTPSMVFDHVLPEVECIDYDRYRHLFASRQRERNTHKGHFGHVLVVGGNVGYAGAPMMAAMGALRVGAGLVSTAVHPKSIAVASSRYPEVMIHALDSVDVLAPLLEAADVIVLGPGLGRDAWAQSIYKAVLASKQAKVLDADALYFLAQSPQTFSEETVLTPHPGEAGSLLQQTATQIQQDRFLSIKSMHEKFKACIVLKGAGSLVMGASHKIALSNEGNPGMASGGMGDLLAGVIAALIAQGANCAKAARVGVSLHSRAGDQVATQIGQRGMLASDLLPQLQSLVNGR